jgi:N-acetylglutamate synthase-like GNAT family acetyltransferase
MDIQLLEIDFGTPAYDECIQLREKMLRIPLGLEFNTKELESEHQDIHLAAYDAAWNLLGCLVMTPLAEGSIQMRQVAVEFPFQSKGIGKQLVLKSEETAFERGFSLMFLHARDKAIPFYKKLNYDRVGDTFMEVGILHQRMEKKIG